MVSLATKHSLRFISRLGTLHVLTPVSLDPQIKVEKLFVCHKIHVYTRSHNYAIFYNLLNDSGFDLK